MSSGVRTLLSNSAWSLLHQVTRVVCLAVVMIILSRHFGPQRFGSLIFGFAFVRVFAVLAAFGLDRLIVRELAEPGSDRGRVLRSAFWLKAGLALASYTALLLTAFVFPAHDQLTLWIVVLAGGALLFQPFDVFDFDFQARNRFRLTFLGRSIPLLICAAIKIAAILGGAPLIFFAFLETVEAALIGGTLFFLHRGLLRSSEPNDGSAFNWRSLLAQGFPLLLAALAVLIYMRADVLLLGQLAGYKAAGLYSAAAQVSEGCTMFSVAILPALFPVLLQWRSLGLSFYRRQYEKLFLAAFLAGLAIALVLTFFAPLIIRVLFGPDFLPAANVLRILAWSPIFVFLGVTQSGYDITEGLTWLATVRTTAGAAVNVGLNVLLIPRFGATGAAAATLISFACSAFLLNLARRPTREVFALQLRAILLFPVLLRPLRYE